MMRRSSPSLVSALLPMVVTLGAGLVGGGCSQKPDTLTQDFDQKKMSAAIAQGRSTFNQFLTRFRHPHPGDELFNVKVRIEDKNGVEYFWVGDLNLNKEPYSGIIGDEPGIVQSVKLGQKYQFTRKDVADWMYMSHGKMQGNYTLRVELESMTLQEAADLRKKVGW